MIEYEKEFILFYDCNHDFDMLQLRRREEYSSYRRHARTGCYDAPDR
jgi:hypothetical protein